MPHNSKSNRPAESEQDAYGRHVKRAASLNGMEFGGDLGMGGGPAWLGENGENSRALAADPSNGTGLLNDTWPGTYGVTYDPQSEAGKRPGPSSQAAITTSEYELEIADLYQPPTAGMSPSTQPQKQA